MWSRVWTIRYARLAREHLERLRAFDRNRVLDEIDAKLGAGPWPETPHRKQLKGANQSFEHLQPVWQLRVAELRVIFDVAAEERAITIRAVLRKGTRTTGEIL
jgi:mRNA-degrading endonuclease RelE of RelBE toxin-antitoxin system